MIRIILAFVVIFGLFFFGIKTVREMTNKERWTLAKYLTYSLGLSIITLATMTAFVLIF